MKVNNEITKQFVDFMKELKAQTKVKPQTKGKPQNPENPFAQ